MAAVEAITPRKSLHTGRSVWSAARHVRLPVRPLARNMRCGVAIVGAGISGAFAADALSRIFRNVIVMDRRAPASGSTQASTAMLQYEIDTPLIRLSEQIGHDRAVRAWRLSRRATEGLIRIVRQEGIACGLSERQTLYLAGSELGWRGMAEEARARNRAGLDCEFLNGSALRARYGIGRTGAILSGSAAVADPVALTRGLLRRARGRGAKLFVPCEIKGVFANPSGVVLHAGNHFVEARAAVFCTGYEVLYGLPGSGTRITSSWAAASAPHASYPEWLNHTLVWEAARPYLYMRTDEDGRLIVGGEDADLDSAAYRAHTLSAKARVLAEKTRRLLSVRPRWSHVWAGAFGESRDGLPVIDAVPGMPHCFTVMGFGGNGTIYSFIASRMMPGLIGGRPPRDADLFRLR